MNKGCARWCAAAVAVLSFGSSARAGFQINYTVTPGSGDLAGKNLFEFYARNDQTGEQAGSKSLLAMEITFQSQPAGRPFTFDFRDIDGDGQADANVFGKDFDQSNAAATFMRFGTYPDWISVLPRTNTYSTKAGANPQQSYGNLDNIQVTGFSQNKALDATQGMGQFFGAAVVDQGVDIHVFGQMAAEKGGPSGTGSSLAQSAPVVTLLAGPQATSALLSAESAASVEQGAFVPVDIVASAPEPGTLGLLALVGAAMVARWRRMR
jgi:hypothetical protein